METIGRIRREHFLKGKTIKEIAKDLEHFPLMLIHNLRVARN